MKLFKYKLFLVLVTFLISTLGCKKEYIEEYIEEKQKTAIVVGNHNNVSVTPIGDTLIGNYSTVQYYQIDIDNDGTDDIEFESYIPYPLGDAPKPYTKIRLLNSNIEIFGYNKNDTTFLTYDTTIQTSSTSTFVHYNKRYRCNRISIYDSIISSTSNFYISPIDVGFNLNVQSQFGSKIFNLASNEDYYFNVIYSSNDTAFVDVLNYKNNCYSFPLNQEKYIGIKFNNSNKLGWIKLNLLDKHKVYLIESALQN